MFSTNKPLQQARGSTRTMDMCRGPLMQQIVLFTMPLFLSWLLQYAFNAADTVVIGRFGSSNSMASVGSTIVVVSLFTTILLGMSTGTAVLTSQYFGAKDYRRVGKVLHTSILISLIGGSVLAFLGVWLSRPLLMMLSVPDTLVAKSILYMRICCLGLPLQTLFSFGSAAMRSLGDTKRPMFFMIFAGIINVILNLLFVISFKLDVAGVALATVISHGVSAFMVCLALSRNEEPFRLHLRKLRIDFAELRKLLNIGVPSGLQSSFFTLSNVIIQSSINSLGATVVAGNAAVHSLEGIPYLGSICAFNSALTFVGQPYGGKQYKRIKKSILYTGATGFMICEVIGLLFILFRYQVLSAFTSDPDVISSAMVRMLILFSTYSLCAMMDAVSGSLRGLGNAVFPAVTIFLSVCVLRVIWVYTVFAHFHTMASLMWSYPLSWIIATAINATYLHHVLTKRVKPLLCSNKN